MLSALRRIVQKVNAAENVREALDVVVHLVKDTISAEACSVFLVDEDHAEYVLLASDGLNKEAVGNLRLKFGEGLVGLVGERGEPINLQDAPNHERYVRFDSIGEEKYCAFLGVPITYRREVLGVIIVQQYESRRFDEDEEAFLGTLSAQLAETIAHAQALGKLWDTPTDTPKARAEEIISGSPGAPGVALGTAVVVYPAADLDAVPDREAVDIAQEIASFDEALESVKHEISNLSTMLSNSLSSDSDALGLFDAYLRILDSTSMINNIKAEILAGNWAQGALRVVIKQHIASFEAMDDAYLRERASDLRDLGQRILFHLQERRQKQSAYPERTILVGNEVSPSALAEVPEDRLVGVVSARGSGNSHVAILARAMGIPTVMGASGISVEKLQDASLILDGYYGQVYINPLDEVREEFERLAREERELDSELEALRDLPAQTLDGFGMSMYVNTGLGADVGRALRVGAEGVGLFRTEVSFMVRDRFPTEEEQRVIYRQLLNAFSPRPVLMRTLDIGGDKALPYFPIKEDNSFLGWRGIRITLDHPDIFLVQIRAMLRANREMGNLKVMLPMISQLSEVEESQRLFAQAFSELQEEYPDISMPPIGVMIEIPSAVYQAKEIAKRVDFVSVGSNDLTQYLLAVDRNNARVASLYDSLHPAVLKSLMHVVEGVHAENKPVSICGEMAGDPLSAVLLLAMGFDSVSMSASRVPRLKWVIRTFTMSRARKLLEDVLEMDDPTEIRCHLELALEEAGLGGLIRAGR